MFLTALPKEMTLLTQLQTSDETVCSSAMGNYLDMWEFKESDSNFDLYSFYGEQNSLTIFDGTSSLIKIQKLHS